MPNMRQIIELETSEHKKISQPTKPLKIRFCFVFSWEIDGCQAHLLYFRLDWLTTILSLRQSREDSRCLGMYRSRPLTVVDDEVTRYHRCAVHFYSQRNHLMIWRNKDMERTTHVSRGGDGITVVARCSHLCATMHFWVHFEKMKGEIAVALIWLNWTVLVLLEIWWHCIQNGCPCLYSPVPGWIEL